MRSSRLRLSRRIMKEKLLILCYRAPYPLRSGAEIRMYQFIEVLSKYYEVDVAYLQENEEGDMTELYNKCQRVEKFSVPKLRRCAQAGLGYCFRGWSLQRGYFYSKKMQQWINAHISEYPNVLCMHIRTIGYVLNLKKEVRERLNIYFDGIDAISMNYYNSYLASSGIKRLVYKMEYKRMMQSEREAYGMFPNSILISERDREYIQTELGVKNTPKVIYNYAIDYGYMPEMKKDDCTIMFMGKMDYKPNVDAVLHFVDKVYIRLKETYPKLQFNIVGGFATDEITALEKIDGINLCGFVENPAELLQQATIVIAPMISGSGLQNKIVQAMYLACTVVTTQIGADGLTDITGEEIVIAENDEAMYEKLAYYLSEEHERERSTIGDRARAYIEANYSYDTIEAQIKRVFGVGQ